MQQSDLHDFILPEIKELPSDEAIENAVVHVWLSIMLNPVVKPLERLKASEHLARYQKMFEADNDRNVTVIIEREQCQKNA